MTGSRTLRLLLPLGAMVLAAGCAQDGAVASLKPTTAPAATTAAPTASKAPPGPAVLAPLTGLPATAAGAKRPAVAVAVPVSGGVGLQLADLVVEEYETATSPRAIALFQSRDATQVGPVGQIRPVDTQLLPILRPLYANSGGATGTNSLLQAARVAQITTAARPAAFTPGTGGLMTSTAAVLAAAPAGTLPPPPVLLYAAAGDAFATSLLRPARSVTVTAPGGAPETWTYSPSAKRWTRSGSAGVSVANLVLQTVPYKSVTLKKPARTVQSARIFGRGACYAISADHYTPCSWYKPAATALTSYVDHAGVPLRFAAGPTWVVLTPPGTAVVAT